MGELCGVSGGLILCFRPEDVGSCLANIGFIGRAITMYGSLRMYEKLTMQCKGDIVT